MTKAQGSWYAVRTKPGFQRMAHPRDGSPAGESTIERNMRSDAVDCYMPAYWIETVHHRKKILLEKRYPLLVGYCFVNLPSMDFERVRSVDGVMCFLRGGREFGPVRFPESVISDLIMADFNARQDFLFEQHRRREDERMDKIKKLRNDLKRMLPKGRAVRVNMTEQAGKIIDSLPEKTRQRVQDIVAELNGLTGSELIGGLSYAS